MAIECLGDVDGVDLKMNLDINGSYLNKKFSTYLRSSSFSDSSINYSI